MNLRETIYNALNVRGLNRLQAYASCGRAFSCLSLKGALCALVCLFALSFAACEKELIQEPSRMYGFYTESCGLMETSADSVVQFWLKLRRYVSDYPESMEDEYFPPTVENLDSACAKYGVVYVGNIIYKTEWDGIIDIYY